MTCWPGNAGQSSRWGLHTGPAPRSGAGREGVPPTAKKRGDGLERRPPVGTRWPLASARRIGKWRRGSPLGTCPTGRTLVIGSARSPRPHEKGVALTLAGPGVIGAGFALPRDAGRRPAFQAVPALLRSWQCAISLRVAQRCRGEHRRFLAFAPCCRPEAGVPSRPRALPPSALHRSPALRTGGAGRGGRVPRLRCKAFPPGRRRATSPRRSRPNRPR